MFQKSHLQRRASDLDATIEEHDQQLDAVLNAVNLIKHAQDKQALHDQVSIYIFINGTQIQFLFFRKLIKIKKSTKFF